MTCRTCCALRGGSATSFVAMLRPVAANARRDRRRTPRRTICERSISNPPGRVCAPQARPPARRRRNFWGIKGPGRLLGRKPSREGFGAETLPGGFVGYLMAQAVNPPGRVCVPADYHPTIYLRANPPDRVFGANRKTLPGGFLCVRRLSPNHRLKRKPCRQGFWRKL